MARKTRSGQIPAPVPARSGAKDAPDPANRLLDEQIASAVFGYRLAPGPDGAPLATVGDGAAARLVEVPPASTDLATAWQAAQLALQQGRADGFQTSTVAASPTEGGGCRATFLRSHEGGVAPICGAVAPTVPRAICGALLMLYDGVGPRRIVNPIRSLH